MEPNLVCPHCNSTDIISVQGDYFCVSCGQTMSLPKRRIAKRGPGRPKAKRLDAPVVAALSSASVTPKPAVPVEPPAPVQPIDTAAKVTAPPLAAVKPMATAGVVDGLAPRRQDLESGQKRTKPAKVPRPKLLLDRTLLLRRGLQGLLPLHVLLVLPGVVALLASGVAAYTVLHHPLWGGIGAGLWLIVGLALLGAARTAIMAVQVAAWNHRPLKLRAGWRLAFEFGPRLTLGRVVFVVQELILLAVAASAVWYGKDVSYWPYGTQVVTIFVVLYLTLMGVLITWVHHSLVEAAMIEGDLGYVAARRVVSKLAYRRLEFAGAKLGGVFAWVVVASLLVLFGVRVAHLGPQHGRTLFVAATSILIGISGYVTTTASFTGELYRQLAAQLGVSDAARLTALPRRPKAHSWSRRLSVALLLVLAAGAIWSMAMIVVG